MTCGDDLGELRELLSVMACQVLYGDAETADPA
jgi:hypothetical protein